MTESIKTESWAVAPVLGARDVRLATAYYEDKLGFTCEDRVFVPGGDEAVYAILNRGGVIIHLQIRRREINANRQEIESNGYFTVTDVDALYAEFLERGAIIVRPPVDAPNYGMRDFIVEDPDGNRLLFGTTKR